MLTLVKSDNAQLRAHITTISEQLGIELPDLSNLSNGQEAAGD